MDNSLCSAVNTTPSPPHRVAPRAGATPDSWGELRSLTAARIASGRAGGSLPTRALLDFRLAHARARDAVQYPFSAQAWAAGAHLEMETLCLSSSAPDLASYLQHPDWGRVLSTASRTQLETWMQAQTDINLTPPDIALIVTDGLSALAVERHAAALLHILLPLLEEEGWNCTPLIVVERGRVALQDEVGTLLGARCALTLIGERPGLAMPDSLGAYLVWEPHSGNTDAQRNCVSNIRPEGLPLERAVQTILFLLREMFRRRLSGVALKDQSGALGTASESPPLDSNQNELSSKVL